jgi:hypothetical protein
MPVMGVVDAQKIYTSTPWRIEVACKRQMPDADGSKLVLEVERFEPLEATGSDPRVQPRWTCAFEPRPMRSRWDQAFGPGGYFVVPKMAGPPASDSWEIIFVAAEEHR